VQIPAGSDARLPGAGGAEPPAGRLALRLLPGGDSERAAALAARLGLPGVDTGSDEAALWLQLGPEGLSLQVAGPGAPGAVRADLVGGRCGARRRQAGARRMPIARAAALARPAAPRILDATGGLLADALVLASLGASVWACERHPVIVELALDALRRAAEDAELRAWLPQRLRLLALDAREVLSAPARPDGAGFDAVYLDPMYPPRSGSAAGRKELAVLLRLTGPETDAAALLECALDSEARRVIVKRPARAAPLGGRPPDLVYRGRSTRFDVYLRQAPAGAVSASAAR